MDRGNHLITAANLVDEVAYLGGFIVLLKDNNTTSLRLTLSSCAQWLRLQIHRRKTEIIAELQKRYLRGATG